MAETTDQKNVYVKQRVVAQDIEFGLTKVIQIRAGQRVEGTQVNASTIPYDANRSIADVLKQLLDKAGIA